VVGALSAFYHDSLDIGNPQHREISAFRLVAKLPTIGRHGLQYSGRPAVHVSEENDLSYRELHAMMFAVPRKNTRSTRCWCVRSIGFSSCTRTTSRNASTSTVRLAGSRGQSVCLHRRGHACLWGPAHGGANEAALQIWSRSATSPKIGEFIKRGEGQEFRGQA